MEKDVALVPIIREGRSREGAYMESEYKNLEFVQEQHGRI